MSGSANWSAVEMVVPPAGDGALNGGVVAARGGRVVVAPFGAGCFPMAGETCAELPDQGRAYLYTNCTDSNCSLAQTIRPPTHAAADAVADRFGAAIALDQDWLAVAAPRASTGVAATTGMVHLYQWVPEGREVSTTARASPPPAPSLYFPPPPSPPSLSTSPSAVAAAVARAADLPGWALYVLVAAITISLLLVAVVVVARARGASIVSWVRPTYTAHVSRTASPRTSRGRTAHNDEPTRKEVEATSVVYSM